TPRAKETPMTISLADKRAAFRRLHDSGCFVIPNPYDAGSARYLQHLGFKAIPSSSASFACTIAKNDNGVQLAEVLAHLKSIVTATDIPVNADFEGGFADDPEGVARNVTAAVATGI